MMTLALQDKGWQTVFLNEPLTEGLAPEGLKEYVTQRARWCLGLMQIARSRLGPLSRNNLRLRDRWRVIDSVFYWLTTFSFRIVSLTYPLLYWFFNITALQPKVAPVLPCARSPAGIHPNRLRSVWHCRPARRTAG